MKFPSGYCTRPRLAQETAIQLRGFFVRLAGNSARRTDYASSTRSMVEQPSAFSVAAVASHWISGASAFSAGDCALNIRVVIPVQAKQVQGALKRRQRRVKRGVLCVTAGEDAAVAALKGDAAWRFAVWRVAFYWRRQWPLRSAHPPESA